MKVNTFEDTVSLVKSIKLNPDKQYAAHEVLLVAEKLLKAFSLGIKFNQGGLMDMDKFYPSFTRQSTNEKNRTDYVLYWKEKKTSKIEVDSELRFE